MNQKTGVTKTPVFLIIFFPAARNDPQTVVLPIGCLSPQHIADGCIILFFLWFALKTFIPSFDKGAPAILGGILAVLIAISTFLSPLSKSDSGLSN